MGRARRWAGFMARLFAAAVLGSVPFAASAYTVTVTSEGKPVRWHGEPKLNLVGNPKNQNGVDAAAFRSAVVRGLQRWQAASQGKIGFDYWQGTEDGKYEPNSEYNGISSIFFSSASNKGGNMSPNVLGLTQVWYDTDSGEILETDIQLNDRNFVFTTDAHDTSGFGNSAGVIPGSRSRVFLENVITHELGHALGLSHSGSLQATMLFMESPEQAHLSCDEHVGIHAIYPTDDAGTRGSIKGSVLSQTSAPVFGAHVLAISRRRGVALAGGITQRDGSFEINGLEPGNYFLMVEPFKAGTTALPSFYEKTNVNICSGREFSRTVLTGSDPNKPSPIAVASGRSADAGTIEVRCAPNSAAAISALTASSRFASAPIAFDGGDPSGFGFVDDLRYTNPAFYRLERLAGRVEIHILSYSLYSPIRAVAALLDEYGNEVEGVHLNEKAYQGDSGFVNYDTALVADNIPEGEYTLKVSSAQLQAGLYPAGHALLDRTPFVIITGSINEGMPALSRAIPLNGRCVMEENFPEYTSPAGDPPRNEAGSSGGGFCGSTRVIRDQKLKLPRDPSNNLYAITAWFLPWAVMGLIARVFRWRARAPGI